MNRRSILCGLLGLITVALPAGVAVGEDPVEANRIVVGPNDWPWWRGPNRNGIAAKNPDVPLEWSDTKNVKWKAEIPGRGHGSATVVGDQVFLATAEETGGGSQSVLCFDRKSGKQLWKAVVHRGGLPTKGNKKASHASSTVACDGKQLYINFVNKGAAYTTALSRDGRVLWQAKITDYVIHQGYGSSPAIYQSLVVVSADNKGGGAIAGLDRKTGRMVWKHTRPKTPNYASPIILNVNDRDQLIFTGCNLVSSFDPLTGAKLWETAGATTECVTSTVTDGRVVITSGGYPTNHVSAIVGDGSKKLAWKNTVRVYVPSLLIQNGYLYAVTDAGVAMCWEAATGKEMWKHRLGGTFTASPVLAGGHLFATDERGKTHIFKADPKTFQAIGTNTLGQETFATPTICGNHIYTRVAVRKDGKRQEVLYCLGK